MNDPPPILSLGNRWRGRPKRQGQHRLKPAPRKKSTKRERRRARLLMAEAVMVANTLRDSGIDMFGDTDMDTFHDNDMDLLDDNPGSARTPGIS
ncbi:hypothetical protein BAUCODRAFT_39221 [Baudoinia panamericana UAMH 10762]|uniref:Uncharacterized protein n=1 Tax=Baudoinia panamericana (strain UAMH 10762) TaxID=717646 RepID=M2LB96_BAUPA|nr:uncharacterized protein BAUCODRAFT_39221 [Baudoinia panamericana UAMH 10762]EMC91092.1 hypothetical protein BAUCODRAFT_39221 [Baudoinia panamericana UAMH 10762]